MTSIKLQITSVMVGLLVHAAGANVSTVDLMPRAKDYTSMWWAEGFPHVVPTAPWLRCIRTGNYGMMMNTETMEIPRLGPVNDGSDYKSFGFSSDISWDGMAPAALMLRIAANGKTYTCTKGGKWDRYGGPRLIESGRFFQRGDVTNLLFTSADGEVLNVDARFETAAWADRLGMVLYARPARQKLAPGEASFGKVGGGFGLDGVSNFEIPHDPSIDAECFSLSMWVFVPADASETNRGTCWLVCKNSNESSNGNFGFTLHNGVPYARLNIGGGREGQFIAGKNSMKALKMDSWNHLVMTYDGDHLKLYIDGRKVDDQKVGLKRVLGNKPLVVGRRADRHEEANRFKGVVDEIRIFNRALTSGEVRQEFSKPDQPNPRSGMAAEWCFVPSGRASDRNPREQWSDAEMAMTLSQAGRKDDLTTRRTVNRWTDGDWRKVSMMFDPVTFKKSDEGCPVRVEATEVLGGRHRDVEYDSSLGWHRVDLDGLRPISPPGVDGPSNDAVERVKVVLSNPSSSEQIARLMFDKSAGGIHQRMGSPMTGISAMLRDQDGNPTGIPVQLSKNWHTRPEGGVYSGNWFHGITQVRLAPGRTATLELTISYGNWGGVPAASHAQLCLIGWGTNQHWSQSALGSWGESICYEPEQGQANCSITDVRPLMVNAGNADKKWSWTINVGGGDFLRLFDPSGDRVAHSAMRTTYLRQGPCLTEVVFSGNVGNAIRHSETVTLSRTDDIVRGIYQIRMRVNEPVDFSRFVIFQIGADTYNFTAEKKIAIGNDTGVTTEWDARWGGNAYRTEPREWGGRIPWASLHEALPDDKGQYGATANRGMVIRSWKAKLGGKSAQPFIAERGLERNRNESSILDVLPPPGLARLEAGDYIEATIEHIVMPQHSVNYYGPDDALRKALVVDGNTWRMIAREAVLNDRQVDVAKGTLEQVSPDIRVRADKDEVEFTLSGGMGYVPVTVCGLSSNRGYLLTVNGKPFDQAIHGNDYWQCDYHESDGSWSLTYNIPSDGRVPQKIRIGQKT